MFTAGFCDVVCILAVCGQHNAVLQAHDLAECDLGGGAYAVQWLIREGLREALQACTLNWTCSDGVT